MTDTEKHRTAGSMSKDENSPPCNTDDAVVEMMDIERGGAAGLQIRLKDELERELIGEGEEAQRLGFPKVKKHLLTLFNRKNMACWKNSQVLKLTYSMHMLLAIPWWSETRRGSYQACFQLHYSRHTCTLARI